jgi:hypothetical protein
MSDIGMRAEVDLLARVLVELGSDLYGPTADRRPPALRELMAKHESSVLRPTLHPEETRA